MFYVLIYAKYLLFLYNEEIPIPNQGTSDTHIILIINSWIKWKFMYIVWNEYYSESIFMRAIKLKWNIFEMNITEYYSEFYAYMYIVWNKLAIEKCLWWNSALRRTVLSFLITQSFVVRKRKKRKDKRLLFAYYSHRIQRVTYFIFGLEWLIGRACINTYLKWIHL